MKNNGWKSYLSWNRGKNEQICTVKFQNFLGQCPQTPILGRGYGAPPKTPPPRHSGASRLRASLGAFGPSIVPLCVQLTFWDILGPGLLHWYIEQWKMKNTSDDNIISLSLWLCTLSSFSLQLRVMRCSQTDMLVTGTRTEFDFIVPVKC